MSDMKDIKEIERRLFELSSSFVILLDKLKAKGIITQEEYDVHTIVKKDFIHKFDTKLNS